MKDDPEFYINRLRERQDDYAATIERMKEWEDWYHLKHYEGGTDAERTIEGEMSYRHTDTTPTDFVRQGVAMMTVPDPVRTFWTDAAESERAKAIQDKAEKYVAGVWRANRARQIIDPIRAIVTNQWTCGRAYAYVWWDARREKWYRKEKGVPRDAYFPIVIEFLRPALCFPNPEQGQWSWTDDFYRAESLTIRRVIGMWGEKAVANCIPEVDTDDYDNPAQLYDYIDIWQWEEPKGDEEPKLFNGILYNDEWIKEPEEMKGYRDLPIVLIPAIDQPADKLEDRMISPLDVAIQNVKLVERIYNRAITAATYQADPTILRRMDDATEFRKGPGQIIDLKQNENLSYLQGIGVSPQILQILQMALGDVERSTLARVAYGNAPASWSGYMANQAIAGSTLKNQPIAQNLSQGLSDIDRRILWLTEEFSPDEEMTAFGKLRGHPFVTKIKGQELAGLQVTTQLTPKVASDEQSKAGLAQMYRSPGATGDPLLPDSYIHREIMGVEDSTGVEREIIKQKVLASPTLTLYTVEAVLKASDWPTDVVDKVVAEIKAQMPQPGAAQGGPGGPMGQGMGAPPGAGGPPQGGPPPQQGAMPAPGQAAPAGAEPTADQLIAVIQQGMAQGAIPQDVGNQAIQALQQGTSPRQVYEALKQSLQGQAPQPQVPQGPQAPLPPQAPVPQGPPMQAPPQAAQVQPAAAPVNPGDELRAMIDQAVGSGQLPQPIAQVAISLLDMGVAPEDVMVFLKGVMELLQAGYPPEVIALVVQYMQQGQPAAEALRAAVAEFAVCQLQGGAPPPGMPPQGGPPQGMMPPGGPPNVGQPA